MTDKELYDGFSPEAVEEMEREAKDRWGHTDAYAESRRRVARMSREERSRVKEEGGAIDRLTAEAMAAGRPADSADVQALMARKYAHLRAFYDPTPEMFAGLGRLYVDDPRFHATYEAISPGLAEYLGEAMAVFAASRSAG